MLIVICFTCFITLNPESIEIDTIFSLIPRWILESVEIRHFFKWPNARLLLERSLSCLPLQQLLDPYVYLQH